MNKEPSGPIGSGSLEIWLRNLKDWIRPFLMRDVVGGRKVRNADGSFNLVINQTTQLPLSAVASAGFSGDYDPTLAYKKTQIVRVVIRGSDSGYIFMALYGAKKDVGIAKPPGNSLNIGLVPFIYRVTPDQGGPPQDLQTAISSLFFNTVPNTVSFDTDYWDLLSWSGTL